MKRTPSTLLSFLPILFLVGSLSLNMIYFTDDVLSGSTQMMLLISALLVCGISILYLKTPWHDLEKGIVKHLSESIPAILILLLIGVLSGTWMISGVVPAMIYYGLQVVYAPVFLATACIVCAIVSVSTGSSWTTVATIGIAMLGIGKVLGYSDGVIAGAIISGAYFGDKISPLSDTTNLASSSTGTPLFTHIRNMLITTTPTFALTIILFLIVGFYSYEEGSVGSQELADTILAHYSVNPVLFVVPAFTIWMIIKRVPAFITLFVSSLLAAIFAIVLQGNVCQMVSGITDNSIAAGLVSSLRSMYGSVSLQTDNELFNQLTATKGMAGMLNTVWLIICAMVFGGSMDAAGMLMALSRAMIRFMHNAVSCVSSTVATCILMNITTADQYISILLPGKMYSGVFKKRGFDSSLLSRTLEDSATVTSVLIPWNTCGMTQASVLNVATLTYLPYCFFNIISPIMSIFIAAIGYKIKRIPAEEIKKQE
ncbi:MAG: Na+/H+ antiporter NhaC family protein [Bacteroidales bacterium]